MTAPDQPRASTTSSHSAGQLVASLTEALFAQSLGHSAATRRHEQLQALREGLAGMAEGSVRIALDRVPIQVGGQDLPSVSLRAGRLRRLAMERGVTALELGRDTSLAELGRMLDLLGSTAARPLTGSREELRALHDSLDLRNVSLHTEPPAHPAGDCPGQGSLDDLQNLTSNVQDNHVAAADGRNLLLDETRSVVERAAMALEERPSELLGLASYNDIDRFTVGHSVRVALLAMHTARAAGLDGERLQEIGSAALLHDIGKSLVPAHVLFKRGRLAPEEWAAMAEHPRLGAQILVAQRQIDDTVVGVAFCHHMRPDGSGYPQALMRFRPGSVSNLIRVCDVFEALTAVRPYKLGMTPAEALVVMRRNPAEFDQNWLRFFAATVGPFPIGSHVELEDGSQARVLRLAPADDTGRRAWDRPQVVFDDGTELDLAAAGPAVVRPARTGT